jgi:MFS family permease
MNALEWRAVFSLGALYALRMIGMFMVLPVFALYAGTLDGGAQGWQIGFAIGVYGLTQALLQIPMGMASDRWGRKPVIVLGMLVFALGSALAGAADSIGGVTAGRALQGAGAISAAVAALLADVTRPQVRTTAMAILGAGMGLAFVLALVLGPVVAGWIGVDGIFWLTAALALLGIPLVLLGVPTPDLVTGERVRLRAVLADCALLRLDGGIFLLHACMTALFVAAPFALVQTLALPGPAHWQVYLPVLLLSLLPVFPLIRWAEQSGRMAGVFRGAVIVLVVAQAVAAAAHAAPVALLLALLLFFAAFNFLEGALPSLISRQVAPAQRGAALGVYSTAQFLGGATGGILGGLALQLGGVGAVFATAAALAAIWVCFATGPAPSGRGN